MRNACLSVLLLACVSGAAVAAPVLSVDSPIYSATVTAGTIVPHTFVVTNLGDEALHISRVSTSCGCTTAALAKNDLASGEFVRVEVSVNTSGFYGTVTRTVSVESNDPAAPVAVFTIQITIPEPAVLSVPSVSPSDLAGFFYVLLDVRTVEEYAAGHLLGAINIPLADLQNDLAAWVDRLPRTVPLVIYCLAGGRSLQAATVLTEAGFTKAFNLEGGITRWQAEFGDRYLFAW